MSFSYLSSYPALLMVGCWLNATWAFILSRFLVFFIFLRFLSEAECFDLRRIATRSWDKVIIELSGEIAEATRSRIKIARWWVSDQADHRDGFLLVLNFASSNNCADLVIIVRLADRASFRVGKQKLTGIWKKIEEHEKKKKNIGESVFFVAQRDGMCSRGSARTCPTVQRLLELTVLLKSFRTLVGILFVDTRRCFDSIETNEDQSSPRMLYSTFHSFVDKRRRINSFGI